jgi:Ca-activated chloride channel family protein
VGLATFAGRAELEVAPTEERQDVVDALGTLETSLGTVIGDGLTTALDAIQEVRASGAAPAAALLLSDGRDTGSAVSPADAAERARTLEVPVFTVVTGQVEGGEGGLANLEVLEEISTVSDGDTFTAETADELTRVYENLGSALSVDLDVEGFSTPLVVAAIGLAIVAGFMLVLIPR